MAKKVKDQKMKSQTKVAVTTSDELTEEEKVELERKKKEEEEEQKRDTEYIIKALIVIILLILLLLCLHSCQARDAPINESDRTYEDDVTERESETESKEDGDENYTMGSKRINLQLANKYSISDDKPVFYIGYPEENEFDVVFSFTDDKGEILYQTKYVKPGTNVAVNGTEFLGKGNQKLNCKVAIYDRESGVLIANSTTIVLNINYQ